jgi:CubicO group peptidase (beta-lactamase class C family)
MNTPLLGSIALDRHYVLLAFIAALLLTTLATGIPAQEIKVVAPEKVGLSSERLARLDKAMQEEIDQKRKAGIVVLIARRGSIAHFKTYGMADIESGVKMRTDHLFNLQSMAKTITSVALLMLYEEGKFQLADPLEKYIPAFKGVKVFAGLDGQGKMILEEPKRKIAIHDVFRHTAGFVYGFGSTPVDRAYQQADIQISTKTIGSLKELVERIATMPLLYHPGDRWVYSFSHDVQGYLVEYFSGMRLDDYISKHIFKPLGMRDAVYGRPKEYVARFATIYGPADGGGLKVQRKPTADDNQWKRNPTSAPSGSGGGGLSCSPMDYFLFSQMLLNGGKLGGARILGRKTVELMTSNNLPSDIIDIGESLRRLGFGLGVPVLLDPVWSSNLGSKGQIGGLASGASTFVVIDPKEEMISLFFTQYSPADDNVVNRFQTLVYQAIVD